MRNKSIAKREAILRAAFGVFCDRGYYEMRMDDVARSAGVAKGTVYLYFKDKPDLYLGITRWLIAQALGIVREVVREPLSVQGRLTRIFNRWTESLLLYPAAIDLLFPESRTEGYSISRRFHMRVKPEIIRLVDTIAELIKEGVRAGEFRKVEPRLAALSFLNAFRSSLLIVARGIKVKSASARSLDLFFNGISTFNGKGGR